MVDLKKIIKTPWLCIPTTWAYAISHTALMIYGRINSPSQYTWRSFTWRGLNFANPLGTSGGLDKNAELVHGWWAYGAGFVEVGTVTPKPQGPNPGDIIMRDVTQQALWNKMGFPNKGVAAMKANLRKLRRPHHTPIFVNIGKNRDTSNADAANDYLFGLRELREEADAFVVNISSPNTTGLRDLLLPENLKKLLTPLIQECAKKTPLLLKLSPDMTDEQIKNTLDLTCAWGIDGWVLTNTTLARAEGLSFPKEGGVSGQPLAARSKQILKLTVKHLGDRCKNKLIVSVGGVSTAEDALERLNMGANLVQVYSTLVFQGPNFFRGVAQKAVQK